MYRQFLDWEWFRKPEMVQLFLYLLLNANAADTMWQGVRIRRGQLLRGSQRITADTGLTRQQIRTCLNRLEKTGEITREIVRNSTDQGTLITICEYERYQEAATNQQPTSNRPATDLQPTSNRPPTTDKEYKNNKKEKNIFCGCDDDSRSPLGNAPTPILFDSLEAKEEKPKKTRAEIEADTEKRRDLFYRSLVPYVETYGKEMIRAFFDYWSEMNKSRSKMRWEQQATWELSRRLKTWDRKSYNYGIDKSTKADRAADAASVVSRLAEKERNDC